MSHNGHLQCNIFHLQRRLIVDNVGLEDDGAYTITASNNVGETVATAKLVCHSKLPFLKLGIRCENF